MLVFRGIMVVLFIVSLLHGVATEKSYFAIMLIWMVLYAIYRLVVDLKREVLLTEMAETLHSIYKKTGEKPSA